MASKHLPPCFSKSLNHSKIRSASVATRRLCPLFLVYFVALSATMVCPGISTAAKLRSDGKIIGSLTSSSTVQTASAASDVQALINFMAASDPTGVLMKHTSVDQKPWTRVNASSSVDPCAWFGVICRRGRVWKLVVEELKLNGTFPPDTLSRLSRLEVLSLKGNMLTGRIPDDLWLIRNLKTLYLNENRFSGEIPIVFSRLHRLHVLNLANNNLTGSIPAAVAAMSVRDLVLQDNQLSGGIPDIVVAANFNISNNNLSGPIPPNMATKYRSSSFAGNLLLCGNPLNVSCAAPQINASSIPTTTTALSPCTTSCSNKKSRRATDKIAASLVCSVVMLIFMAFVFYWKRKYKTSGQEKSEHNLRKFAAGAYNSEQFSVPFSTQFSGQVLLAGQPSAQVAPEGEEGSSSLPSTSTCNLMLFKGNDRVFSLEDLLRASAQMLGKGSIGIAYKVTLEGDYSVAVKRLRNMKIMSRKNFEHQLEVVRKLVHTNVAPLCAYYYTADEKLLVFDYYANGNLFSLLHLKHPWLEPPDWTARLKIARGVARGLAYLHETIKLPHGNLKASNILLNCDGEAHIADFGLAQLTNNASATATNIAGGYCAPECTASRHMTQKVDVYAFGILMLEILTGHKPTHSSDEIDLPQWVNSLPREEVFDKDMGRSSMAAEEDKLVLLDVSLKCIAFNPEKRPKMSRVLEYIELLRLSEDTSYSFHDTSAINIDLRASL